MAEGKRLHRISAGLSGADKNLGRLETIPEVFPDARYQRCTVHFYQNIFSVTLRNKMKSVVMMLKTIHARGSKEAAREKPVMWQKSNFIDNKPILNISKIISQDNIIEIFFKP